MQAIARPFHRSAFPQRGQPWGILVPVIWRNTYQFFDGLFTHIHKCMGPGRGIRRRKSRGGSGEPKRGRTMEDRKRSVRSRWNPGA